MNTSLLTGFYHELMPGNLGRKEVNFIKQYNELVDFINLMCSSLLQSSL